MGDCEMGRVRPQNLSFARVGEDAGMTPDQADRFGKLAEKLDACLFAAKLPMDPKFHLDILKTVIRDVRDEIAALYQEITGENPWETNPLEG